MQAVFAILTIVLLAACADDGLSPLPSDQVRVRFPAGGVVDVIEVDAVNPLPLRKAELVSPDGQATPASYLNVNPSPSVTSYQGMFNGPYGGDALGVGNIAPGMPLQAVTGGAPQERATLLLIAASASIPLPDPVKYRRDWRNYRIRLSFGDAPDDVETREVDAPAPPPGG